MSCVIIMHEKQPKMSFFIARKLRKLEIIYNLRNHYSSKTVHIRIKPSYGAEDVLMI